MLQCPLVLAGTLCSQPSLFSEGCAPRETRSSHRSAAAPAHLSGRTLGQACGRYGWEHQACLRCGRVGKLAAKPQAQARLWREACAPGIRYRGILDQQHVPFWRDVGWECDICNRRGCGLRSTPCAKKKGRRGKAEPIRDLSIGSRGPRKRQLRELAGSCRAVRLSGAGRPGAVFDLAGQRTRLRRKTCTGASRGAATGSEPGLDPYGGASLLVASPLFSARLRAARPFSSRHA